MFVMTDSEGRQGGSSDVKIVGISDDSSCLDASSPSSTSALPASTTSKSSSTFSDSTSTTSSSPSESTTDAASNGNISIGAIAGTVIGALLFLAVVITLGLFCLRKRREGDGHSSRAGRAEGGSTGGAFGGQHSRMQSELDLTSGPHNHTMHPYGGMDVNSTAAFAPGYDQYNHSNAGLPYDSDPFSDNPPSQYNSSQYAPSQYDRQSQYTTSRYPPSTPHLAAYPPPPRTIRSEGEDDPFNPFVPSQTTSATGIIEPFDQFEQPAGNTSSRDSMSTAQRKAAMAGNTAYKPSRFILHTDLEDVVPSEIEEEVVELPPQYSERRAPSAGLDPAVLSTTTHSLSSTHPSLPAPNPWQDPPPAISG
ncbi:hypothetical protein BDQ17DRAFT_1340471 [Cyathus striatus]|nr:hypothetical protein BDQ17DRAFT_1340471 [Cyathus striatus]